MSIRQDGPLQNLIVARGEGKRYRVVSGERRYRALRLLLERGEVECGYVLSAGAARAYRSLSL